MQEEPTTTPDGTAEEKSCGCSCEFCAAGKHDQCESGMCTMKQPTEAPKDDQA